MFDTSAVIESPVKPISLKNNSTEAVCTHFHKLLCHVLPVISLGPVQHSDLLRWLHHHLQREVAAKPPQAQQSKETSPDSSLQCGQETPTAPTDSQMPVQLDGNTTHQGTPTNNLPAYPQFAHPSVTPQTSPIEQKSPIRTQTNLLSQNSTAAPEATMLDTPEEKIPKSLNGEGVKNSRKQVTTSTTSAQDSRLCFRCKQPGHLKKDCPEFPYCSKCRTRGHIPAKCPTKQQEGKQQDERCGNADERCETCREDWKKAQDRPSSPNRTNKCLNCAGDHGTCDCPTRQQPQAHPPPIGNPANGAGIYKNNSQFQNHSPQQHSQQSVSMVGISTPTIMVNNQLQMGPQLGQQQHPSPQIPPVSQHANSPIRHNQFNQHFQQPSMPQLSPLMAPPQQYNPQIPPHFHQYLPTNHCLQEYFTGKWTWQKDKKSMTRKEKKEKCKEECEK